MTHGRAHLRKQPTADPARAKAPLFGLPPDAENRIRRLELLRDIALAVSSTLDLRTLLDALLERLDARLPYSAAAVSLWNREMGRFELVASRHLRKRESAALENKLTEASRNLPSSFSEHDGGRKHATRFWNEIPLIAGRKSIGILHLAARTDRKVSPEESEILGSIAEQVAMAIRNSQLFEQAKRRAQHLETDIMKRKRTEKLLERSRDKLRRLARHLQSVREAERERMAREIHDELAQALTAMKIDVSWLQNKLLDDQTPARDRTRAIASLIDTTIETVRNICTTLRPPILDKFGLVAAIRWQAQEFETRTGIQCKINLPPIDIELDRNRSVSIFRVFQEALTNVARHANATTIEINLTAEPQSLILEISDNGRGIKASDIYDAKSLGILGMRERALLLNGEFHIHGRKGQGTCVTIRLPIAPSASMSAQH